MIKSTRKCEIHKRKRALREQGPEKREEKKL